MKKILLVCILFVLSAAAFSQDLNLDKHFSLSEIRSSDDLEYEKFTYNREMLLETTHTLFDDGMKLIDSLIYDEFNNIVKLDLFQFINNVWTYVSYIDYTYDENRNRISRSNYNNYGSGPFILGGIYNYYYDENNKLSNWELYMGGTTLMQTGTLTYNDDGRVILELGQDVVSGVPEDSWKIDYQYNTDGLLKSTSQSFWDGSSWDVFATELFYYDEYRNCIKWDHKNGNVVTDRKEYEYNMEYTADQIYIPINPEEETSDLVARNNMVTIQHWYTENDAGNLVYICDYLYKYDTTYNTATTTHPLDAVNIRVYPNPASELITIVGNNTIINKIDVVDNTGKIVLNSSNLNKQEAKLDISSLKTGIYYLRLATSKGVVTERLMVK
jgi:hypothetical protein